MDWTYDPSEIIKYFNFYNDYMKFWKKLCGDFIYDVEYENDEDGLCESDEIFGCSDQNACNYSNLVTEEDGSCIYLEFENLLPLNSSEFIVDNNNINDSLTFVWEMADNECGAINYKLSIFNDLDPVIIRFTSDTSLIIPFYDLNIEDWAINNYDWNIYATNSGDLDFESESFNFIIDATYLNNFSNDIPKDFFLSVPYPNPFNPETSFNYGIPYSSDVSIKIHNSLGQLIYKIIYQNHQPGLYSFKWNPENISSGTYYIQLISDDIVITKKAIYLK